MTGSDRWRTSSMTRRGWYPGNAFRIGDHNRARLAHAQHHPGRDPNGAPRFVDLMRRPQHFYAFDLLWLDGGDLRDQPLIERKRLLRGIVPPQPSPVLYVDHVVGNGVALFQAACVSDLEGIVANLAGGRYTPDATTWVKIKSRVYLGIPMMSISHSDLMPIRSERSDAGLSQCEIVIDIRQEFCLFS